MSRELLQEFIADENAALAANEQGGFYPSNHHRIHPLITKAGTLLEVQDEQRFYVHLLRLSVIPKVARKSWPILKAAYDDVLPLLDSGYPRNMLNRVDALVAFGYDERGALSEPGEYNDMLEVLAQCRKYTSIPNMIAKLDRFVPFAQREGLPRRILAAFRQADYLHNGPRLEDDFYTVHIAFWGLCVIVLLDETVQPELIADFATYPLPAKAKHQEILERFVEAVRPHRHL